jgi:acyl-coenzyme A thioesterase PaaI-like protein
VIDVPAVLHGAGGFVRTLGARVLSSDRHEAVVRLDAGEELHNHLGGPHAAAIFGLGETTAFALLLEVFGDLVEAGVVPLIKRGTIDYKAVVTGPLIATARLADDEAAARASVAERGRASFDVDVVFRRESDNEQTATMVARMALLRP